MGCTARELARVLGRRGLPRMLAAGVLALVALAMVVGLRPDETQLDASRRLAVSVGLGVWVPLTCLVLAAGVLGGWRGDGSGAYLWMRPVGRGRLVVTAWAVAFGATVVVGVLPLVFAVLLAGAPTGLVAGTAVAAVAAAATYSSVFTWLGVRSRHAAEVGIAYVLLWEGFVAEASEAAAGLSVRSNALVALEDLADVSLQEAAPARTAVVVLAAALTGGMLMSWRALHRGALLEAA